VINTFSIFYKILVTFVIHTKNNLCELGGLFFNHKEAQSLAQRNTKNIEQGTSINVPIAIGR